MALKLADRAAAGRPLLHHRVKLDPYDGPLYTYLEKIPSSLRARSLLELAKLGLAFNCVIASRVEGGAEQRAIVAGTPVTDMPGRASGSADAGSIPAEDWRLAANVDDVFNLEAPPRAGFG